MPGIIKFKTIELTSTFLDPRQKFEQRAEKFQVRFDPLTGRTGHFSHFGAIKIPKPDLQKYNDPEIKGFCPFCGDLKEQVTPKFVKEVIPQGRLSQGEALLVPNLYPYDIYSAVAIMTNDHVVPLECLSAKRLFDTFSVGLNFLKTVKTHAPSLPYHIMTWNYMPPSGGGLVHPHQQYFATAHPGNQFTDEFKAAEQFYGQYKIDFWSELIKVEKKIDERYIGRIGSSHWLASFVSLGILGEIICVFPKIFCIEDFFDSDTNELIQGLHNVFRYFMKNDIFSFNASLFFGPKGQNFFPAHFRIVPRTFLNLRDFAPDLNFFQALLQEPISVIIPEEFCKAIKVYFT